MTEDEASWDDCRLGTTEFVYPREPDSDSPPVDRDLENAVKTAQWLSRLIFSGRTTQCQHLYVSVGIALLKNELNLAEIAAHFDVTQRRVEQVVKKVKSFSISEQP